MFANKAVESCTVNNLNRLQLTALKNKKKTKFWTQMTIQAPEIHGIQDGKEKQKTCN